MKFSFSSLRGRALSSLRSDAFKVTRDLRKSRSSPLSDLFSTILTFAPLQTQNSPFRVKQLGCSRSASLRMVTEKTSIRAQSFFSDFGRHLNFAHGQLVFSQNSGKPGNSRQFLVLTRYVVYGMQYVLHIIICILFGSLASELTKECFCAS
jgi:hypothetical protein